MAYIRLEARILHVTLQTDLPNGFIKNDTEHTSSSENPVPSPSAKWKAVSHPGREYAKLFTPIWAGRPGASLKVTLAVILELSAAPDLDVSFVATQCSTVSQYGTTSLAAMELGRSSVAFEVEPSYLPLIVKRLQKPTLTAGEVVFERREPPSK